MSFQSFQGFCGVRLLISSSRLAGAGRSILGDHRGRGGWRRAPTILFAALVWLGAAALPAARAQSPLTNGGIHHGELAPAGDADSWTLTLSAGANLMARVGSPTFTPRIRIYDPSNVLIGETTSGTTVTRDGVVSAVATNAGIYTVLVSATYANQVGTYDLHVAASLGDYQVSDGDQGGVLANGALNNGILTRGDLDLWSFEGNAGEGVMLRVGSPGFTPWIRLYGPSGSLVTETTSGTTVTRDGFLAVTSTNAGIYLVVVSAAYNGQEGPYGLTLARSARPIVVSAGDQGGPMTNGVAHTGDLAIGDLDVWTFDANQGDGLMVRVGSTGSTGFTPWIRLYGPAGQLIDETTSGTTVTRDGFISVTTTNTGPHTLVVGAAYSGQSGDYTVHLARAPGAFEVSEGDQGGALANGALNDGILTRGDLDLWSFEGNAGEGLMLRVGSTGFTPWIRLYGPSGSLVMETTSGTTVTRDGFLTVTSTNAGTYLVVVSAVYSGQEGPYELTLARSARPIVVSAGDQGGELTSGVTSEGELVIGDLDLWSFAADAGNSLMIRVGSTTFTPWIRVYDPLGVLVEETTSGTTVTRDGSVSLRTTNSGMHTIVVSASYPGQVGAYTVNFARAPLVPGVGPGDEGGNLINGNTNTATLNLGDLDVWSFIGTPGDSNVLRVASTGFTPWIRLYGPDGALVQETTSGTTVTRSGSVNLSLTNAGLYTVVVSATYPGQSGNYTFKQSRVPPDLIVPETQFLDESGTLQVSISAQDPDEPVKPLQFTLLSGPPGLSFQLAGATNATLTWATTEADGPVTNEVVASVTDVVNGKAFIRTNRFTVVVREINTAPVLTVPGLQTLDELTPLHVSATATDADLPANARSFSLVDAPEGMTIEPATGAIAWTPSEAQGPSTYEVGVVVTDQNPWAANAQSLSTTNRFTVMVREINRPPQLTLPANRILDELTTFEATATISDPDLPANPLTLRLVSAPAGMTLDPVTGVIRWTPSEAQGPMTAVVVVALTDDSPLAVNSTGLGVTNSFELVVREVNSPPLLTVPADTTLPELTELTVSAAASDSDVPSNTLAFRLESPPPGLVIDAATGAIRWTPTEAQGPSTNVVRVVVTDSNSAAQGDASLSVTNSFRVIVTEINLAPTLEAIADQNLHFGSPLTIQAVARDEDLPANVLRFSLEGAPAGMTVEPGTGAIAWTPLEAQVGTYSVTVRVTDDAATPASASRTFQVKVAGEGATLGISVLNGGLIQVSATGDVGAHFELQGSADLRAWEKLTEFQMGNSPYLYIDPTSLTVPARFYRLLLRQ